MSTFTDAEIECLRHQPLGRVATAGSDGRPHVTPRRILAWWIDSGPYEMAARDVG